MTDPDRLQLWSDFLQAWPPERVREMTLAEYTNPDRDDAFIYWLESRLDQLGSIWGGSAFKFGIYHRDNTEPKKASGGRIWGNTYAWLSKFGQTEQEAFATIRARLVQVIEAAQAGNFERIDEIDLALTLKWKVAFLYQDREHPGVFPIFKEEALFHHYQAIDPTAKPYTTPYSVMYATLLDRHGGLGGPLDVGQALWSQFAAEQEHPPHAWALPIGWLGAETIERLCSANKVEPEHVDTFLENLLCDAKLAADDKLVLLVEGDARAVGTLTGVGPGEYAWEQTPVNFPSNLLVNPTSEIKELSAAEWRAIRNRLPKTNGTEVQALTTEVSGPDDAGLKPEQLAPPCNPHNIILYGPPGTGKTYSTVRRALELILGPEKLEGLSESGLTALFREHQARGQIEFVTFHQAYGYEEFVEGLRPVLDVADGQDVRYELHDGVFKRIALRAAAEGLVTPTDTPDFDELWGRLVVEIAEEDVRVVQGQSGKQYVLQLTGQGNIATVQCEVDSEGNVTEVSARQQVASKRNSRFVWEHRTALGPEPEQFTSAGLSDLFARERGNQGSHHYTALWIVYNQLLALSRTVAGRRQELIDRVARVQQGLDRPTPGGASFSFSARNRQYVLIIDEINRGNVSKILGELITLLEPDKRLGARNELKLPLSYSPTHRFAVPPNLHVLGTMNTADRSIALMDVALRRRFTFEELMPSSTIIREVLRKKVPDTLFIDLVVELFDTLNARIRFLYDRDHQLGHAYFLEVNDVEDLRRVFVERVIPLLQEYFYGAWDKICTVLGCPYDEAGEPRRGGPVVTQQDGRMVYTAPIIQASPFQEVHTLGFDHDEYEERLDFTIVRGFQEGRLSRQDVVRTFVSVLQLDPESYASRVAALMGSGGDTDEARDVSEAEATAEYVETEVAP
jgi:5-methylcytosine-specific restriction enzyme B